jgi:nitrous oxidase accessory protein NosD
VCQTFQAALALTAAGGEIYVLDSANYGAVTINKAVSITSEGAMGGVLAPSGAGITIAAGAGVTCGVSISTAAVPAVSESNLVRVNH